MDLFLSLTCFQKPNESAPSFQPQVSTLHTFQKMKSYFGTKEALHGYMKYMSCVQNYHIIFTEGNDSAKVLAFLARVPAIRSSQECTSACHFPNAPVEYAS